MMTKLQVIVNAENDVLGTLVVDTPAKGSGGPERFGAIVGPGQRLVEIEVDDSLSALDPDALHAKIKTQLKTMEQTQSSSSGMVDGSQKVMMTKLQVIVNAENDVLGTLVVDTPAKGSGGPERFGAIAGPGQRLVEIEVDDSLSALDPDALHAQIKTEHLR
jgi:ribosomal protein L16/L10AE